MPPAEAPGSLSPARPRTPPRTCSGLRPPEEGRAQASRKVREQGEGRPHPRVGGAAPLAGPPGPRLDSGRALHRCRGPQPSRALHPRPPPLRSGALRFRPGPRRAASPGAAWGSRPPDAGAARAWCARWRSLREAAPGPGWAAPAFPLPGLRNRSSQQPKFCLVPQGASFPTATLGRNYGDLLSFIKGNKHKHAHARTQLERPSRWLRPWLCGPVTSVAERPV